MDPADTIPLLQVTTYDALTETMPVSMLNRLYAHPGWSLRQGDLVGRIMHRSSGYLDDALDWALVSIPQIDLSRGKVLNLIPVAPPLLRDVIQIDRVGPVTKGQEALVKTTEEIPRAGVVGSAAMYFRPQGCSAFVETYPIRMRLELGTCPTSHRPWLRLTDHSDRRLR